MLAAIFAPLVGAAAGATRLTIEVNMNITALILAAELILPFGSLQEYVLRQPTTPGLAGCGEKKVIIVSRAARSLDMPEGSYLRLIINADMTRFAVSLQSSEGELLHAWVGYVQSDDAKTFTVALAGTADEIKTQFANPCAWLFPETEKRS